MERFNQVKEHNLERLELYVPIVERVHGGSHPEFHDVRRIFDEINAKIKNAGSEKPKLDEEFKDLRKVTDNYTVPDDVCESYEAVYKMLAELDEAYQA
ncbi:MAG: iron-sulfur cluster repair di-iron protein, ric [Clostridiales bacterium]|nr:iron-sulfur cluster repair di-iron protein, ric [Clostridiales bacterium]